MVKNSLRLKFKACKGKGNEMGRLHKGPPTKCLSAVLGAVFCMWTTGSTQTVNSNCIIFDSVGKAGSNKK